MLAGVISGGGGDASQSQVVSSEAPVPVADEADAPPAEVGPTQEFESVEALKAQDDLDFKAVSEIPDVELWRGKSGSTYLVATKRNRDLPHNTLLGGFGTGKHFASICCNFLFCLGDVCFSSLTLRPLSIWYQPTSGTSQLRPRTRVWQWIGRRGTKLWFRLITAVFPQTMATLRLWLSTGISSCWSVTRRLPSMTCHMPRCLGWLGPTLMGSVFRPITPTSSGSWTMPRRHPLARLGLGTLLLKFILPPLCRRCSGSGLTGWMLAQRSKNPTWSWSSLCLWKLAALLRSAWCPQIWSCFGFKKGFETGWDGCFYW